MQGIKWNKVDLLREQLKCKTQHCNTGTCQVQPILKGRLTNSFDDKEIAEDDQKEGYEVTE